MATILKRSEFLHDPVFSKVLGLILKNHIPEEGTVELFKKDRTVGLHEARTTFAQFGPFNIKYEYESRLKEPSSKYMQIAIKVTNIVFYDSYLEYEAERVKTLSSKSTSTGLNHN